MPKARHQARGEWVTDLPAATAPGTAPVPVTRLEPDAIGVSQDTVIGMASSAGIASHKQDFGRCGAAGERVSGSMRKPLVEPTLAAVAYNA